MDEAIRAQVGPQEAFLANSADIAVYGGGAGGGKTWALLLEPLRHIKNPDFGAVIFRRTSPQIRNEGGMWDESQRIYSLVGGTQRETTLEWAFPSGARIKFSHMQYESDKYDWQGSQIPLIEFDELTHFTKSQFFYMLSRSRSTCGVKPYMRATTNPDPDSWVAEFIAWWIGEDGYPLMERAGILRWFVMIGDDMKWGDSPAELQAKYPESLPKSVTFIPAKLEDNPALMEKDPGYLANLNALPYVERMRLQAGNWKVRPEAGNVFNRGWFEIVDEIPAGGIECRFWDFAATKKELAKEDPDFTAGVKMRYVNSTWYVLDVVCDRWGPAEVERNFLNISLQDADAARQQGIEYSVAWEQEPGSAGKRETWRLVGLLKGITAHGIPSRGDKLARAKPLAAQAEVGNVKIKRGSWNDAFLNELHNQPAAPHDDRMDAAAGAFAQTLSGGRVQQSANPFYS